MYKCPDFSEEKLHEELLDEEPIFYDVVEETTTEEDHAQDDVARESENGSTQQSKIIEMLDSVTSSLILVTKPICALSNKVKILKSYLQNL